MQYLLLIHSDEAAMKSAPPEATGQMHAAYMAYTKACRRPASCLTAIACAPPTRPPRSRITGGKTQVLDGPYAETKEQLAGYYLIDVANLDAALSWAARCPGASHGSIEVRPIWAM